MTFFKSQIYEEFGLLQLVIRQNMRTQYYYECKRLKRSTHLLIPAITVNTFKQVQMEESTGV